MKRAVCSGFAAVLIPLGMALPAWAEFTLPPLPYAPDALQPAIDATTMTIHHDRHHRAYVSNLNGQIMTDLMVAPPKPGDVSFPLYNQEVTGIFSSLKRRAAKVPAAASASTLTPV